MQAEQGAAVVHQIEFNVTPTAEFLKFALLRRVRGVFAALNNRQVRLDERIADGANEREAGVEIPLVEVVEKQSADPTRLITVLDMEVAIAPRLVARIDVGTERRAGLLGDAVPMNAVFLDAVIRGQVKASAEPPHRFFAFFLCDEEPYVGVRCRHVRVVRVHHQRHTEGFETSSCQLRSMGAGRGGKAGAEDVGKIDPALFEDVAVLDHAGSSATPRRPLPGVLDETGAAIFGFERGANAVLKIEQVGFDGIGAKGHGQYLHKLKRASEARFSRPWR